MGEEVRCTVEPNTLPNLSYFPSSQSNQLRDYKYKGKLDLLQRQEGARRRVGGGDVPITFDVVDSAKDSHVSRNKGGARPSSDWEWQIL